MFDIAWSKLMIIGVVALIVIGPKDLPGVLRTLGEMIGKLRRMADEFRGQFNDAMRETQFEDIKKDMSDLGESVRSATSTGFNPIQTIRDEVKGAVEARNGGQASGEATAPSADVAATPAQIAEAEAANMLSNIPLPDMAAPVTAADFAAPAAEKPAEPAKSAPRKRKPKASAPGDAA